MKKRRLRIDHQRVRRAIACFVITAAVIISGCSASGGKTAGDTSTESTGGSPASSSPFGKDITVGGLTMRVEKPFRQNFSPQAIEVDVTFTTSGPGSVKTPNPVLTCGGKKYPIDNDIANYPSELSDSDHGTWAWSPGPECEKGSFKVGQTTFSFTSVAQR